MNTVDTQKAVTWYYVQEQERKGPVEGPVFESLVREGTIGPHTLVWHEGMAAWQPYAELTPVQGTEPAGQGPDLAPGLFRVPCSHCGGTFQADQLVHVGGVAVCAACAIQGARGVTRAAAEKTAAERLRRAYLRREMGVQQLGFLSVLGGGFFLLAGIFGLLARKEFEPVLGVVMIAFGGLHIGTGIGLNRLRPWARIAGVVIGALYLLSYLGRLTASSPKPWTVVDYFLLIFTCCALYVLLSKEGSVVFSEPYRQAIAATPHVKQGTSVILVVALVFLAFLVILALAAMIFAR